MNEPHKHAELIKAWADGAEIEALFINDARDDWSVTPNPAWSNTSLVFRIKPERKPDVVTVYYVTQKGFINNPMNSDPNLELTWDGETGNLKSAEVLC